MSDELTLLKNRALQMGITFSPNIGVTALKAKIQRKLDNTEDLTDEDGDGIPDSIEGPKNVAGTAEAPRKEETEQERDQRIRAELQKEQLKLVRLRIANLDPSKAELRGEIVTVGNRYLGDIRKFIPYGEATDNGYHVPYIIYQHLKDKKFNQVKTRSGPEGQQIIEQRMVPEFSLEVMEPLTEAELAALARNQAAAAGL